MLFCKGCASQEDSVEGAFGLGDTNRAGGFLRRQSCCVRACVRPRSSLSLCLYCLQYVSVGARPCVCERVRLGCVDSRASVAVVSGCVVVVVVVVVDVSASSDIVVVVVAWHVCASWCVHTHTHYTHLSRLSDPCQFARVCVCVCVHLCSCKHAPDC